MLEVTVQAHQGLVVGGPVEMGVNKPSLPYVPGSTLRGALATSWIREYGLPSASNPKRDEFIDLFEGDIRYGLLLQDGTGVVPLTAQRCKYPRDAECAAWSEDAAYGKENTTCPCCNKGIETGRGEISGVLSRRVLRTKLEDNGLAKDGHLYARYELSHERTYHGLITGTHPWLAAERGIWIGGRTTTSGQATFKADRIAEVTVPASRRPDGALVVRLTAPALVVDDAGRPTLDPVPEILRLLGLSREAVTSTRLWTRPQRVGGWHVASGLPKSTEPAISIGSVFVLHLREQGDLQRLAREGIGLRRNEGYGTVELNPVPWRPAPPEQKPSPAKTTPLAELRKLGLLERERDARWLLDRGRRALIERERGRGQIIKGFFGERVAIHFSDEQQDAVKRFFASEDLPGALSVLEFHLSPVAEP